MSMNLAVRAYGTCIAPSGKTFECHKHFHLNYYTPTGLTYKLLALKSTEEIVREYAEYACDSDEEYTREHEQRWEEAERAAFLERLELDGCPKEEIPARLKECHDDFVEPIGAKHIKELRVWIRDMEELGFTIEFYAV